MDFRIYRTTTKKHGDRFELHTPSCRKTASFKKRNVLFRKAQGQYAEDVAHKEGKDIVFDTKGNFVSSEIKIHTICCRPFRKPDTSNPACPHCGNTTTVFQSNIGVGRKEFSCTGCKKMFVHLKPKREKTVKIKIKKAAEKKSATKKSKAVRQVDRIKKKEARDKARAERKAKRDEKKAARVAARTERMEARKVARISRMAGRIAKVLGRMEKLGADVKDAQKSILPLIVKSAAKKRGAKKR